MGEKIVITLLSLIMLSSIAMLAYRLVVVSPTQRSAEPPIRIL